MPIIKKCKLQKVDSVVGSIVGNASDDKPGVVVKFPADKIAGGTVNLTEDDIAEDFAQRYGDQFRFDHDVGRWFVWDGGRWKVNKTELAFDHARHLCRKHRGDQGRMASKKAAEGVECMARRDQRLAVTSDIWDQDPLLLGTPGGTVDLRIGALKEPVRIDYITKHVAVTPAPIGALCPIFKKFLNEATDSNKDVQTFLQQFGGYCLTGLTNEHALLFVHGHGGNGKSVFQNAICEIMGDYAKTAAMETFTASRHQRHLTEIAMLDGARFVAVSETENGQAWSETRINQLTGGDFVSANYMRRDHFTFRPKFKLMISGNHKPRLQTVNDAARRRFNIVPFVHKPKAPDQTLGAKLREEYPAILRWMIDGCLDWQANGLVRPEVVTKATADYFEEQDLLGRWIDEKCERGPGQKECSSSLYKSWKAFAEENGEEPGSATSFGSRLPEYGFDKMKSSKTYYLSIKLKPLASLLPADT